MKNAGRSNDTRPAYLVLPREDGTGFDIVEDGKVVASGYTYNEAMACHRLVMLAPQEKG